MDFTNINKFYCGGCTAKLPQGMLKEAVSKIPIFSDPNLLVGFDTSDDGAVYKLTDELAVIQTLDFFTPMLSNPFTFGQVAATNALSDIAAMGGVATLALNIVGFPENEDPAILAEILQGGAEKVKEAGAVLCGGHSIADKEIKYGLSVMGTVHPSKILHNNTCNIGDVILLTKPLGVGMVLSAYSAGYASEASFKQAVTSMTFLNMHTLNIAKEFDISACTDVTGFGFLGHLNEMVNNNCIVVDTSEVIYIDEAYTLACEFLTTAGGQKNRNYLEDKISFNNVPDAMQEILFDPQTSGGLLIALPKNQAQLLLQKFENGGISSSIVAEVVEKRQAKEKNILVY